MQNNVFRYNGNYFCNKAATNHDCCSIQFFPSDTVNSIKMNSKDLVNFEQIKIDFSLQFVPRTRPFPENIRKLPNTVCVIIALKIADSQLPDIINQTILMFPVSSAFIFVVIIACDL